MQEEREEYTCLSACLPACQLATPVLAGFWVCESSQPSLTGPSSCPLCSADVRTQALYQLMDEGFVGLIFSVFNNATANSQVRQA